MFDIEAWKEMDAARGTDKATFERIRNRLTEENRPFAVRMAASFHRRTPNIDLQDCIQTACEGLMAAIVAFNPRKSKVYTLETYDPKKGGFLTYAQFFINRGLNSLLNSIGDVSRNQNDYLPRRQKLLVREFIEKHDRFPNPKEIGISGMSQERLERCYAPYPIYEYLDLSCDVENDDDHNGTYKDKDLPSNTLDPEQMLLRAESEYLETEILDMLEPRTKRAIDLFVMQEKDIREVAAALGVETTEARAIIREGLSELRAEYE